MRKYLNKSPDNKELAEQTKNVSMQSRWLLLICKIWQSYELDRVLHAITSSISAVFSRRHHVIHLFNLTVFLHSYLLFFSSFNTEFSRAIDVFGRLGAPQTDNYVTIRVYVYPVFYPLFIKISCLSATITKLIANFKDFRFWPPRIVPDWKGLDHSFLVRHLL